MQENLSTVKVKDIATLFRQRVFSPAQTIDELLKQDKDCVYGPVMYHVRQKDNFYVAKKSESAPVIQIEPKDGWNAHYIAFWLNSSEARTYFTQNKKTMNFQLSMKTVGNYPIFVLSNPDAVVSLEKIIAFLQADQPLDEIGELELKKFCELRDSICYQYAHAEELFRYDSSLYQEWVSLWSSICVDEDNFSGYIKELFVKMIHTESLVRSEMKRLRVIKNAL